MRDILRQQGFSDVGRRHITTLMMRGRIDFYNSVRGHSSWRGQTPDRIYFNDTEATVAA